MKLVEMKCKNCSAKLMVDSDEKEAKCQFCGSVFKIDDEVQHVKYDDMEQAGYEFEKGKIRAQEEHRMNSYYESIPTYTYEKKKKGKTFLLVLAWICLFPFTATFFIARSKKMNKNKKIVLIIIMWTLFMGVAIYSSITTSKLRKEKILQCYSQEVYDKLDELIGMAYIDGNFTSSYSCEEIGLKDQHNYNKIEIEMNDKELIAIKEKGKYIYRVDNSGE